MSVADTMTAGSIVVGAPTAVDASACTHCGLDVPAGFVVAGESRQFCCDGCRAAYAILNEHGLERYYALPERRDRPVRASGRSFEEFDHQSFHDLYVTQGADGLSRVELYLEGVHCASCVWLVERVPLLVPGVARAELNVRRSLASIEWDKASVPLSAIARALDKLGYTAHPFRGVQRDLIRRREDRLAITRIGIAGAIAVNVMLPALALYSGWLSGMEPVYARFFRWISLALTVPAILGPGRVFFTGALAALRTRTLHMDLPIAIALGAGFVRGAINTVTDTGPIYFDGLTALIFLLLCGRWLQQRGQRHAGDAAELLYSLTPSAARIVEAGDGGTSGADITRDVPASALLPDHVLDVRAGETLAADGVVSAGHSAVDVSLLTGESRPSAVHPGDEVFAGTLNVSAPLRVRVTKTGETSRLGRILEQVEASARRRAPVVLLADRMAGWFVATVLALAIGVYWYWARMGSSEAMDNAIALLLVTCPCALALATPLAVTAAIGRAARAGIFIKGSDVLELLSRPGQLLLDKTGTITEAQTRLVSWRGPEPVKALVLALEAGSTHPIAAGFRRAWESVPALGVDSVEHVVGGGVAGIVDGKCVTVGSPSFVRARGGRGREPEPLPDGLTPVWVAVDGAVVASAGFGDPIRADARDAIDALALRGWRISVVSGDDSRAVAYTAGALGLAPESCFGGVSPEGKLAHVERARRDGSVVMVGDGVNDAAAMASASVGIGVHGGAEACLATADVYLTRPGLGALVALSDGAARTMRVVRRNIGFSLAYNAIGAALAVTGVITPLIAALLMPASSLTVIIASWRSRTFDSGEGIHRGLVTHEP